VADKQDPEPGPEPGPPASRDRQHLFPGRPHVVKVRYASEERDAVGTAAQLTGLRPGGFVAVAALLMARGLADGQPRSAPGAGITSAAGTGTGPSTGPGVGGLGGHAVTVAWTAGHNEAVLAELVAARLALRRYGTLVNQAVAALHSGQAAPVWLQDAVAGADSAVARVDGATARLARGLA